MRRYWILLFFLLLPAQASSQEEAPFFKLRAGYSFQSLSFAPDAHGASLLTSYTIPKRWSIRNGFQYLNKFNDEARGYLLGTTFWLKPTSVLSLDAEWAPNQTVLPRQAYMIEFNQTVFKKLVPSVAYRFVDYQDVNAHIAMPGLTWYFWPRWNWSARYFFSATQTTAGENFTNHSAMTRLGWNPIDPLHFFAGYARSNESFESGSPLGPLTGFSSNHIFGGGSVEIKGVGVDVSVDYENRDNGATVTTLETGFFLRW